MYEDLEPIANLKFGEIVERVHREKTTKLSETTRNLAARGLGHPEGGPMIQARLNSALESNEQVCRAIAEIWLDLIQKRNRGRLSRTDVDFIKNKVKACTDAQVQNLAQAVGPIPTIPSPNWVTNERQNYASRINGQIGRDLEIKLREQDAFPPPDVSFWAFIRAFGESWSTKMSGPATVPFTIAALLLPGYPRFLFTLLAVSCALHSSYYLWRRAKSAK